MIGSVLLSKRNILKGNPVSSFVLQAPNATKWIFSITPDGALRGFSGAAGAITDIKVTGGSIGEASFGVTNDGELTVKNDEDLSGTALLNDNFRMRAISGGQIYKLTVSSDDEIQLVEV